MILYSFDNYLKSKNNNYNSINKNPVFENTSIKGIILNTKIKNTPCCDEYVVEKVYDDVKTNEDIKDSFDAKNAIKPLLYLTGAGLAAILGLSFCFKGYSKTMATDNGLIRPGDLPRSMNILQEHQLATFRALRDPNKKNLLGLAAVGLMSAFTLIAKNFTDGIKDIWIKKQKCDIEADFQRDMIDVETSVFKGKLAIVDKMYVEASNTFNQHCNNLCFKGTMENKNKDKKKNAKNIALLIGLGSASFLTLGFLLFKNCQKTAGNLNTFMEKMTDSEIRNNIASALKIEDKKTSIQTLENIFKRTNMPEDHIKEILKKVENINDDDIVKVISKIKQERIFAQAPEALGGVSEKIQYYCYIDEERGYLYNWVLNPENKFNKYLFLSFCLLSSVGYLSKTIVDAIKNVAVEKENKKSEFNLKKKMVEIEINSFKAKKEAAIKPLMDNYLKTYKNKTMDERRKMAQNILFEIKNGPPYIYS